MLLYTFDNMEVAKKHGQHVVIAQVKYNQVGSAGGETSTVDKNNYTGCASSPPKAKYWLRPSKRLSYS